MTRRANDFYETAPWQVRALLHHVTEIRGIVVEPCVGDGSIARVLREHGLTVITNDIDPAREADYHYDAADPALYARIASDQGVIDHVVTNPPYQMPLCTNIVANAVTHARRIVAMNLRLSFEEPTAKVNPRGPFLVAHPLARKLTMPRYSYTGDGKSDSVTTAWMVWARFGLSGRPILSLYRADQVFAGSLPLEQSA